MVILNDTGEGVCMDQRISKMVQIWNMTVIDWMGYTVSQENYFTYHHMNKHSKGGRNTINNGAVLTHYPHQYLHTIEYYEPLIYREINDIFWEVNLQRTMPTKEQLLRIHEQLLLFEVQYQNQLSGHGKPLIKKEYLKRLTLQ